MRYSKNPNKMSFDVHHVTFHRGERIPPSGKAKGKPSQPRGLEQDEMWAQVE
jgi:hypothetical protein